MPKTIDFEDSVDTLAELIREYADADDGVGGVLENDNIDLRDFLVEDQEKSFLSAREYQVAILEAAGVPRDEIAEALGLYRSGVRKYSEKASQKAERAIQTVNIVEQSW